MHHHFKEDERGTEGFRVQDRRSFDASGERRSPDSEGSSEERSSPEPTEKASDHPDPEAIDSPFLRLVGGLAAGALVSLGLMEDPLGGGTCLDLGAARDSIGLLEALHEKTKGNLDPQEKKLLEQQLTELRLLFVRRAEEGGSAD